MVERHGTDTALAKRASDLDIAAIPAIAGFDIDLRGVVTPEASVSLCGGDLVIGPAFGPILAVVDFVRAAVQGRLVILSDRAAIAADRLLVRLRAQPRLAIADLTP